MTSRASRVARQHGVAETPATFRVRDQLNFVNEARLHVEHERNLDDAGLEPGGAEVTIECDSHRPAGAIESEPPPPGHRRRPGLFPSVVRPSPPS